MSVRKTVSVKKGQTVNYTITLDGVITASGSKTVDTWSNITINEERYTFTLNYEPADASFNLVSDDGTIPVGNTIKPTVGSTIGYTVSKPGYATTTGTYVLTASNYTKNVKLAISPDEYDFVFRISGSSYTLPFTVGETTGAYDLDIHWGDDTTTLIPAGTVISSALITHSYDTSDYHTLEIRSSDDKMPTTSFYNDTKLVSIDTPLMPSNITSVSTSNHGMFMGCTNLYSVSADLFKYNSQITDLSYCFKGCSSLTTISGNIFKYNTDATSFYNTFEGSGLTAIPSGLFTYNTKGCGFAWCFKDCADLESMPTDLFAYCTTVSSSLPFDVQECFSGCNKLQLTADIFGSSSVKTTRFVNYVNVNFYNAFYSSSFTGTTRGTAPDLWTWSYASSPMSTGCFGGAGNYTLTNASLIPMVWGGKGATLTISPTPADANVVLTATGYTQVGNTITVDGGTNVSYTVSKSGWTTETGMATVYTDMTETVVLTELCTYTINPTPADATVTLTATGYTQTGNSIVVPSGTTVNWSVSKTGYVTQSGSKTITTNLIDSVTLVLATATFTINPTPNDATVVLTATGYTQVGNSITVPIGTSVEYVVSKVGYETQLGTQVVLTDTTTSIVLVELVTLTIEPTPSDANVVLELVN